MRARGFTLLEMLVATTIMGVAVVSLLASLSTSLRNAARLTEVDRVALLARRQMDALLLDPRLPKLTVISGQFDHSLTGGVEAGWRARVTPFERQPKAGPGAAVLERVELEIWWKASSDRERTLRLEAYRRGVLTAGDLAAAEAQP